MNTSANRSPRRTGSVSQAYENYFPISHTTPQRGMLLLPGLDLPFIVVGATSLENAVALSIEMFIIHIVTMLLVFILGRRMKMWQRALVTAVISTGAMILAREFVIWLLPDITNYIRLYLYLMAVNGVTLLQITTLRRDSKLTTVLKTSVASVGIFAALMILTGIIREYLSTGTLWGRAFSIPFKMQGITAPFFGFIVLAFLLAGGRMIANRFFPDNTPEEPPSNTEQTIDIKDHAEL